MTDGVLIAFRGLLGVVDGPGGRVAAGRPRAVLTVLSRAGSLPMSCRYTAQPRPAPDSWLPSVWTFAGYTQPSPRAWWYDPATASPTNGIQTGQSAWVPRDGACPESSAT